MRVTRSLQSPEFPNERRPQRPDDMQWDRVDGFARLYSWLTIAALIGGVAVAHKVLFTGVSWTTCGESSWCVAAFHIHEIPFVGFLSWVALYGLTRLTRASARRYAMLVVYATGVQLVFALFEVLLLLDSLRENGPATESMLLAAVAITLLFGAGLGVAVHYRLDGYIHPPFDPRFEHPASERDLAALVKRACNEGRQIRVRGAEHSVNAAIYTDEREGALNVQLDRYTKIVRWDPARLRVTVQAGCHLGVDPNNPASNEKNSLLAQLELRGWALPDLGGITHQTVGGFISTGSMGGSTTYDIGESIVAIRLIDGTGNVHELAPNADDPNDEQTNPFYAAGVSMGLLGIISEVTFQCVPRFDIIGQQATTRAEYSSINLFDAGPSGLAAFFRRTPYSRLLWWPQAGIDKMQVWQARRTTPGDAVRTHVDGRFVAKPFVSLPGGEGVQALINGFYNLVSRDPPPYEPTTESFVKSVLGVVLSDETVEFWDRWLSGLPMDNQISDTFMPTEFTELFIDIEKSDAVMTALRDFYAGDCGMARTGPYACEVYPAKKSRFWMSPSYGHDTIRVDVFWFKTRKGTPEVDFYPQYWELLRSFGFRFHWAKYLSDPRSSTGTEYVRRQFPMWDKFMALRAKMDPHGVFLTAYWRRHLGIGAEDRAAAPVKSNVAATVSA
jgi:D-arabinono-1,4-lactone oxidase